MRRPQQTVTATIEITPRLVAEMLAEMNDEDQAQVFIELAEIAATWAGANFQQWYSVGRHLRTCECSNDNARRLISDIARGLVTCD